MSMSRDAKRPYTRARDRSIHAVDRTYTGVRDRPERPFHPSSQEVAMPSFTRRFRLGRARSHTHRGHRVPTYGIDGRRR